MKTKQRNIKRNRRFRQKSFERETEVNILYRDRFGNYHKTTKYTTSDEAMQLFYASIHSQRRDNNERIN